MKIVCIDNNISARSSQYFGKIFLTKGKIYEIFYDYEDDDVCTVIDDSGNKRGYFRERFVTLEDYRKMKLEKILNIN